MVESRWRLFGALRLVTACVVLVVGAAACDVLPTYRPPTDWDSIGAVALDAGIPLSVTAELRLDGQLDVPLGPRRLPSSPLAV